jgi:hypothetical protein
MMLDSLWSVVRFEYARYIRWRPFWRWLAISTLLTMMVAAALFWMFFIFQDTRLANTVPEMAFKAILALPGIVGLGFAIMLTRRIFSDRTNRGVVADMYMTALHPLEIVLGRLLAVGVFTALAMLAVAPVYIGAWLLGGVSLPTLLQGFFFQWLTALLWASVEARAMLRAFPEPEPTSAEQSLFGHGYGGSSVEDTPRSLLALLLLFVLFLMFFPVVASRLQLPWHVPLLGLMPFMVPQEVVTDYSLGGWTLSSRLVLVLVITAGIALMVSATAQRLGWWSERGYRFQRWGGTVFLLIFVGLNVGVLATDSVPHMLSAEAVVFGGTVLSGLLARWGWVKVLGYYGVALRPCPLKYALPIPLGGIVWEWGLLWGAAIVNWLVVWLCSGHGVAPSRWFATTTYLWCLLIMLQAFSARAVFQQWRRSTFPYSRRLQLDSGLADFTSQMSLPIIVGLWATIMPRNVLSHILRDIVLPASPLGAIDSPHYPLWRYIIYGLYALAVAGALALRAYKREQASADEQVAVL